MSALTTEQVRRHSSNPIGINLSKAPASQVKRLAARFLEEGCKLSYQGRDGENYEFLATASPYNTHEGMVYRVMLGRSSAQEPVTGSCSCTHKELCKHLAAAYLEAKELRHFQTHFCICGREFLLHEDYSDSLCFECITDPEVYPYKPEPRKSKAYLAGQPIMRGEGFNNNCHWCGKPGSESQALWLGPDDTRYYAHTSCEIEHRTGQEVQHV